jgi:hypothetical protein
VLHNADHFRRGTSTVSGGLLALGTLGMVLWAIVIVMILRGHRLAPLAAVSAGIPLAIGFVAVHWFPHRSSLSDSFVEGGASWMSITASLLEIAGAVAISVAGVAAIRRVGGLAGVVS